ncbi:MAG: hypothetical protein IT254_04400 [Chitinophagaceae bacterium]|nr:hypothetical protein [Bacteroidota bacterium]MCC6257539.1 hypothetical protein [Chitinophagaceae bacterium]MCW5915948.1 hypothetical protein [Ferruginibacter sp.]
MKRKFLFFALALSFIGFSVNAQDISRESGLQMTSLKKRVNFVIQTPGYTIHIFGEVEYGAMGNATTMALTLVVISADGEVSIPINYSGQFKEPRKLRKHKYEIKEELNREDKALAEQIMARLFLPKPGAREIVQFEKFY